MVLSDDSDGSFAESDSTDGFGPPGDEYDPAPNKRATRKQATSGRKQRKRSATVKIPLQAKVTTLATQAHENPERDIALERLGKVDQAILARVKKAMALASHEGTGEAEAKAALRMASKHMATYNISQADLIAAESDQQKLRRAGQSTVTIISNTGSRVQLFDWFHTLAAATETFFPCKYYSTTFGGEKITLTFYGIAEETVAAVHAFEMCHNLIWTWSHERKDIKGAGSKNKYRHGVADGLSRMARAEQRAEEQRAIKSEADKLAQAKREEAETRHRELARLHGPATSPDTKFTREEEDRKVKVEDIVDDKQPRQGSPQLSLTRDREGSYDSEGAYDGGYQPQADFDDDDDVDDLLDLDAESPKVKVKADPKPDPDRPKVKVKKEEEEAVSTPEWASHGQLIRFRHDSHAIADQFLNEQRDEAGKPIVLRQGPKRPQFGFSNDAEWSAYKRGKDDARQIDVKRKRLKDAHNDY